ncbi:putative integral membrane protein [Babesia bovis T2Bo]|uniref:Phospholipid or glycerol acyltransferase n=1 Tax=Babesia bovis TaxID=5865 RepID=S6BPI9_BABBO|nr:putative integral membrane protein [Babesia bovis T2Bo]KAG6440228.1 putative integral membrane protein [Babesia bovis T2Bo]BAN66087.1 phospholipid or glycerol acyltransferase [Babesia bovis]
MHRVTTSSWSLKAIAPRMFWQCVNNSSITYYLLPLQLMLVVLDYTYLNITFDAFPWKWWVFHTFCSPITTVFIAYWLPTIYPPGKDEIAIKGEQTCFREYALYANRVMREAILKLNPNVDRAYLQQRVVVSPTLRQKLMARLYGPVLQNNIELQMRKYAKLKK